MTDPLNGKVDRIARSCLAGRVRWLNRVVTNIYDDALRPVGLKISQATLLVVTSKLGVARPAQVCELLDLDTSTLSRNVERMVARGWLEIVPGEDRREQPFRLTEEGKQLLEKGFPLWEAAQAQTEALLGEGMRRTLDEVKRRRTQQKSSE